MWLLITKYIEENYEINDLTFLQSLNVKDYSKDSNYINELQQKDIIIHSIGYPTFNEGLTGVEIKLSGNDTNNNMTFEILT
ncbi:MAG: hypothetical protein RCO49_01275 [Rickettsia endosymbiont of Argas persicus]